MRKTVDPICYRTLVEIMHVILPALHKPASYPHIQELITAPTLVLGAAQFQQMGFLWTASIVTANAGISLLLALLLNTALPRRRYPQRQAVRTPATPVEKSVMLIPEQQDLEWAMTQTDSALDISVDDLTEIYWLAQQRAQVRYDSATR